MQHSRPGTVSSIDAHSDGKHATIRVTHGKRKKDKDGELVGYHRSDSHVTIPKAAAKQYAIGQKVHAGISPVDAEDQADGGADEASEGEAPVAPAPKPAAKKGKAKGKKKGKRPPPRPSPIAAAMQPPAGAY